MAHDCFTDIEFNPKKSLNCQARSCALAVALKRAGTLTVAMTSPEGFLDAIRSRRDET